MTFLNCLNRKVSLRCGSFLFIFFTCCDDQTNGLPARAEFTTVSTLAGGETPGFADGRGAIARFDNPSGMLIDRAGNVYVSDRDNHSIRMVTPEGVVSTFAGTGQAGAANGFRLNASFNQPYGLAMDQHGNLFVSDVSNNRIRKISSDGQVSDLAGGRKGYADGPGNLAMFNHPHGIAADVEGNVYVSDTDNYRIRKIAPDGTTSTLAGNGNDGFVDGVGDKAEFYVPIGIAIDTEGNIFVGDEGNSSIRKITPDNNVSTLAGNGSFSFADGIGKEASFNAPGALALDSAGRLYVADYLNNCIRRVSPSGEVRTIAGIGDKGFADGDPAEARFYYPFGIAVDASGRVYVGDHYNHRVRVIE